MTASVSYTDNRLKKKPSPVGEMILEESESSKENKLYFRLYPSVIVCILRIKSSNQSISLIVKTKICEFYHC